MRTSSCALHYLKVLILNTCSVSVAHCFCHLCKIRLVDDHIKELDENLHRWVSEMEAAGISTSDLSPEQPGAGRKRKRSLQGGGVAGRNKVNQAGVEEADDPLSPNSRRHLASFINNPQVDRIDPNEPKFCICNRVSFGEMVGCDNDDVSSITCVVQPFA